MLITSLITDQMGQHKVLLPINKTIAKFEKETKHLLHVFIKMTKTVTSAKFLHRHDELNVPLTVQLHCLITLSYYTVLLHCLITLSYNTVQITLVITNQFENLVLIKNKM